MRTTVHLRDRVSDHWQSRCSRLIVTAIASLIFLGIGRAAHGQDTDPTPPPPPPPPVPSEPQPPETPPPAPELPEGREIVHASIAAFGERNLVKNLKTFEVQAVLERPMGQMHFHLKSRRDGAFYLVQRMENQPESTVGFDGKIGWLQSSDVGYEIVDDSSVQQGKNEFNILFPYWLVFNPDEHFSGYETVEQTEFEDTDCYRVRLETEVQEPLRRFAFYGVEDKRIRGMAVEQDTPGGTLHVQFIYGEWKPIGELNVFTKVTIVQDQKMQLVYQTVEFDKVDQSVFQLPDRVKELVQRRQEQEQRAAEDRDDPSDDPDADPDSDDPEPDPEPEPEPDPDPDPDPDPLPDFVWSVQQPSGITCT